MERLLILKLGGSVVTHKDQDYKAHHENIERLSREIAEANQYPLIIVHGGGSFGHPFAKKHDIANGFKPETMFPVYGLAENAVKYLFLGILVVVIAYTVIPLIMPYGSAGIVGEMSKRFLPVWIALIALFTLSIRYKRPG